MTVLAKPVEDFDKSVVVLSQACARGDAAALFAELDRRAAPTLAHMLCTVHRLDMPTLRLHRLYSSNPQAYPSGGSKAKAGTAWGRQVLQEQRVFVGEGEQAIAQFFDDHAVIAALGLRSVINVPVVLADACLGTINFLMADAQVSAEKIAAARWAALLAIPGFLLGSGV